MQQKSNSSAESNTRDSTGGKSAARSSVSDFVKTIVDSYQLALREKSITIETDLELVQTNFDGDIVDSVTRSLIENAMNKMPNGGVISLTLIDGNHQWELEVADSDGMAFNSFAEANLNIDKSKQDRPLDLTNAQQDLPVIIPFQETESLRRARSAAISLGGQIQIWDCPQGGTAHVFVAPKPINSRNIAK